MFIPRIVTLVVTFSVFMLSGCVSQMKPEQREPMKQQVTVTVSQPQLPISSTTPITWFSNVVALIEEEVPPTPADPLVPEWVKPIIEANFKERGFNIVSSGQPARYQLAAVITVGDGQYTENAQALFSLYPSLSGENEDHPKGTLLMALVDTRTESAVWRGAVQVFTNSDATQAQVEQRVDQLVGTLLRKLHPNDESS